MVITVTFPRVYADLMIVLPPIRYICFPNALCSPPAGHDKLMAVTQQQLLFAELRDTFARRLTNHLNNVFVHQVTRTDVAPGCLLVVRSHDFQTIMFPRFTSCRPESAGISQVLCSLKEHYYNCNLTYRLTKCSKYTIVFCK